MNASAVHSFGLHISKVAPVILPPPLSELLDPPAGLDVTIAGWG